MPAADTLPLAAVSASNAALVTFLVYTLAVFGLAALSNRLLQKKSFLSEYFLGSRSLGVWAFALTFAATSASGGSFTGFPSKIYTHGWILGLWIGSYIVVPICAMGLLGKRINHVARISGAITVPDVLRDRFRSPGFGLLAVSLILFFMAFNLVAQFKAGSEILNTLLQDVPAFRGAVGFVADLKQDAGILNEVNSAYLVCLLAFAVAVIIYTTWGGFHAVVWTDVMQGVVMVVGVIIMLPLALSQVGGLEKSTAEMKQMTPPRLGLARFELAVPLAEGYSLPSPWFALEDPQGTRRLFRVNRALAIPAGRTIIEDVKVVELTTASEIERQFARLQEAREVRQTMVHVAQVKRRQIAWTDQRLKGNAGGQEPVDRGRLQGERERLHEELDRIQQLIDRPGETGGVSALLNADELNVAVPTVTWTQEYAYGAGRPGMYVTGPGPLPSRLPATAPRPDDADRGATERVQEPSPRSSDLDLSDGFLPLSLAISFFFMWAISGSGQPSSMVRLMAFKNTPTLRRAIFTVAIYYSLIYFPLVIIFCCARLLLPGMDLESDRIMPQMAVTLTSNVGQGWLAGLLIAAPFAAVMSTVDSFLLMMSSALVRDVYQRNLNPEASERTIKRLSYLATLLVGIVALVGAVNPPQFLQDIIVYTGSGLAACFLGPMIFALYWPRANVPGCVSGMLAGFGAHLSLYFTGSFVNGSFFEPYQILNFDPIVVGLFVSFATTYVVTKLTAPPPQDLVRRYFYRDAARARQNIG
ncbi:MAG: hypothetical protein KY476_09225 [Planctomycetes bacterium]|nr:hypothetical protein [Planctomycetota bacterium]